MLAPMLLHLYSEEVRSKFCCLILQLIAKQDEHCSPIYSLLQAARTSTATTQTQTLQFLKRYVHRTKYS